MDHILWYKHCYTNHKQLSKKDTSQVTIHKLRAPGMTWDRLPVFIWASYATAVIQVLATPVVGITLLLLIMERVICKH